MASNILSTVGAETSRGGPRRLPRRNAEKHLLLVEGIHSSGAVRTSTGCFNVRESLVHLSPSVAVTFFFLAPHPGALGDGIDSLEQLFDGLTTLSGEVATALVDFKGEQLQLKGLDTISEEAAKGLAQYGGGCRSMA